MPNKRKEGKKLIAGWLQDGDAEEFKALAAENGMTATTSRGTWNARRHAVRKSAASV